MNPMRKYTPESLQVTECFPSSTQLLLGIKKLKLKLMFKLFFFWPQTMAPTRPSLQLPPCHKPLNAIEAVLKGRERSTALDHVSTQGMLPGSSRRIGDSTQPRQRS